MFVGDLSANHPEVHHILRLLLLVHHLEGILGREHLHPLLGQGIAIVIRRVRQIHVLFSVQAQLRCIVLSITNQPDSQMELAVVF